jgi:hypothetical protein
LWRCYTKLDQTYLKLAIQLKFPLEGLLLASTKGVGSTPAASTGGTPARRWLFLSTSVNSGVAHPIFQTNNSLKLLAIVQPLFSANLTNRGIPFDLFTG